MTGVQTCALPIYVEDGDISSSVTWLSNIDGPLNPQTILSAGKHRLTAMVTDTGGLSASDFVDVIIEGEPSSLSGNVNTALSFVNLTDEGALDWVHWGLSGAGEVNRKKTATKQIGNLTTINGGSLPRGTSNLTRYSWIDGSPATSINNTNAGVRAYGEGKGFSFSVPANTNLRTVTVYVGAKNVSARLEAYLSDNPTQVYTAQINQLSGVTSQAVRLDFNAASSGQTLFVRYVLDSKPGSTGWISLEAATLQGTVSNINLPPSISSSPTTNAVEGEAYSYQVEATDPNAGDVLSYFLNAAPNGMSIDPSTGLIDWIPVSSQIGDHNVEVLVSDSGIPELYDTQRFVVTVEAAAVNVAPIINSGPILNVYEGAEYLYQVDASDANAGDVLTYTLSDSPNGMSIDSLTGLINWSPKPDQLGSHFVQVIVSDDGNPVMSAKQSFTVNVLVSGSSELVGFVLAAPASVSLSKEGNLDWVHWGLASASDVNRKSKVPMRIGDITTVGGSSAPRGTNNLTRYSWQEGTPTYSVTNTNAGIRAYNVGKGFEFKVPADINPQTLTIYVGAKNVSGRFEAYLSNSTVPDFVASVEELNGVTSQAISLIFQHSSIGQMMTVRYVLDNKPGSTGWISLEGAALSGIAEDVNLPPSISSTPVVNASEGLAYSYDVRAIDPNSDDILAFELIAAPAGMVINSISGLISWAPTSGQAGVYDVEVKVSDNGLPILSDTQRYKLTVTAGAVNVAPIIISEPVTVAYEGVVYRYQVEAIDDNPGDVLTYSLPTYHPSGMTIDPVTGLINWLPKSEHLGRHLIGITVTDNGEPALSATQALSLNVLAAKDGELTGSVSVAPATVNLSSDIPVEWVHWGLSSAEDVNRKANVTPKNIGNVTLLGGAASLRGTNNLTRYSWSDGAPKLNVTNTNAGIRAYNEGKGFEFTVPADMDPSTLTLYLGAKNVGGYFEAILSDNSAPTYVVNIEKLSGTVSQIVNLNFQAGSVGQTLTVRYVLNNKPGSTGWISLEAAVLK